MLQIDFENPDKDAVIRSAKEYIHLLEHTVAQFQDALTEECETTNKLIVEIHGLENRVRELEEELTTAQTALSWAGEPTCY